MTDILARLEAAEAGSDELDLAVAQWCYDGAARDLVNYDPGLWLVRNGGFTDSIDAAKALIERALPGWWWLVRSDETAGAMANIGPELTSPNSGGPCFPAYAPTPALAMCIALIRAAEAKEAQS